MPKILGLAIQKNHRKDVLSFISLSNLLIAQYLGKYFFTINIISILSWIAGNGFFLYLVYKIRIGQDLAGPHSPYHHIYTTDTFHLKFIISNMWYIPSLSILYIILYYIILYTIRLY